MKDLVRKKLYSIALMDHGSKTLAMLDIKIMAKLGGMTHRVESEDRSRDKGKARPRRYNLTKYLRKINSKKKNLYLIAFCLITNIPIYFETLQSHTHSI